MMSRRILKLLALCTLTLTLPVAAFAQTSRVEGMALQGDFIKDYTGIYTYVSSVNNVGNLVYGELGVSNGFTNPTDRAVGAVLGDLWEGRYGTWAIHMREFTPQLGQGDAVSSPAPPSPGDPNSNSNESFDIMWGRKFGTTSFGLRLNRSFSQLEVDNGAFGGGITNLEFDWAQFGDENLTRNIMGVGAGIGFEMSPTTNVELGILYQSRTYEISDTLGAGGTARTAEEDGPTTYQVSARAFWQWQPNVMVVPVFKYYSFDLSTKDVAGATADNTLRGWQVGAAGNWTVGSNDLFVLGATFAQNRAQQEAAVLGVSFPGGGFLSTGNGEITETFSPQVFAALETHVNSWLTLRFGATKGAWHSVEVDDNVAPDNLKWRDSPFSMSLGAGVKVGTLQLDGVMNPTLPHNGLYLFSGSSTDPMFGKVSATYSF